jgi:hypothetical protein
MYPSVNPCISGRFGNVDHVLKIVGNIFLIERVKKNNTISGDIHGLISEKPHWPVLWTLEIQFYSD